MRILSRLFLVGFLLLLALPAQAEEFYVELGRENSEAEVQDAFAVLKTKNKALEEYDVFPNAILMPDGGFTYRVQAGPMLDKAEANTLCKKLSRKKISCFVIEGFDPKRAPTFVKTVAATGDDNISPLPWAIASSPESAPEAAASDEISGGSFFDGIGSIFSSDTPEDAPITIQEDAPAPVASREAKVDVAEAIPVALSTDTQSTDSVTIGEAVPIATSDEIAPLTSRTANQEGWLNVQPFLDEGRVQKFWRELKSFSGKDTRNLEMNVVRPVVSHDIPKVIMSLGTFASEQEAMQFCRKSITPASRYLECSFSSTPLEKNGYNTVTAQNDADSISQPENSLYWVEVLSAKNQDSALEKWEEIRTEHDDLLMNLRSQITTSFATPGNYVVRIGPINSRAQAVALCNSLKERKLGCNMVSL